MHILERWFATGARKPVQHAEDITLYYFAACPYCQRVLRAARQLGVTMPLRDVRRDATAQAELVAGGGRSMVPCLRIRTDAGDEWMYESRVIVHYLQKRFATM